MKARQLGEGDQRQQQVRSCVLRGVHKQENRKQLREGACLGDNNLKWFGSQQACYGMLRGSNAAAAAEAISAILSTFLL